ncbi:hypothetical protein [Nocardioides panaciterrulae]|uniref:Uncharacterized protein n=1 Tax=Nocardioides panaciterrulae TaxID=661492 RepID=A0A7Y9EA02_9ACTN|nr:hypothetical protein [Nocardioides panaciterrulae]NYD39931.1 hypothetical protein [Nocardioides panaciterrulae]NYD43963.1 hypothetical protein [Nocardioides panaciterrulae]
MVHRRILAIDPGNIESAWVVLDADTRRPLAFAKERNEHLLDIISGTDDGPPADHYAIEMVASYGMPVGAEVFETCVWIGRFQQTIDHWSPSAPCDLVKRQPVRLHHCHSTKAKDSNVTQALVDRFAPGQPNKGKGTKAEPGWFHGFRADVWQAYALGVYIADTTSEETTRP